MSEIIDTDFDEPEDSQARHSVFPDGPRATAWVLDDSPQQAQAVRVALQPVLEVRLFHDSLTLLEALTGEQPDVLILDWMVPDISGLEVLQSVRERHDEVMLPALMLTTDRGHTGPLEALAAGANDYATKPFIPAELRARVSTLVRVRLLHARARRAERELAEALAREARARSEAQASAAQLLLVTNAIPLLVSFVAADETYGFVNRAYEHWFGMSSEHIVGRKVREVIGEEAYAVMGPHVRRGLAGERLSFEQHGVSYRTGGTRDVRVTFAPLTLAEGMPAGCVALVEDITGPRAMEAERERLAGQRAADYERQSQFEQQLIGIVSHDLRTPLNVIALSSARLAREEQLSASAHTNVVRIQNATDRAVHMVADLLDFTQARLGGGIRIERRTVNVHTLIDKLLAELEAAFPDRCLEAKHQGDGLGEWDPERISQLAQNLITNALKYSPADSVVEITTQSGAKWVTLRVYNIGAPIAPEKLPVLFEPLQRGVSQVDRATRSVGLGLYIVKKIAEAHGGTVHVESSEAQGTTFTVMLPVAPPARPA